MIILRITQIQYDDSNNDDNNNNEHDDDDDADNNNDNNCSNNSVIAGLSNALTSFGLFQFIVNGLAINKEIIHILPLAEYL